MDQLRLDPRILNAQRDVVVAVNRDKGSQNALRWALDNLLVKGQSVTLIHVNQGSPSCPSPSRSSSKRSSISSSTRSTRSTRSSRSGRSDAYENEQEQYDQSQDMFFPFRIYTSCKDISCYAVTIDDSDVVKALIEYVKLHRIETLVLGAATRNRISRIFNKYDIPSAVLKGAPDFCNVFIVSKGEVNFAKAAKRPLRSQSIGASRLSIGAKTWTSNGTLNSFSEENNGFKATFRTSPRTPHKLGSPISENIAKLNRYSNMRAEESGMINEAIEPNSMRNPGRRRSSFDNMDSQFARKTSKCLSTNTHPLDFDFPEVTFEDTDERKSSDNISGEKTPLTREKIEALEEKLRLLELQMKHTMDMYYGACKEALKEKEKNKELQLLRKEDERKLVEAIKAKEEALESAEKEKALRIAATNAVEVPQTEADDL